MQNKNIYLIKITKSIFIISLLILFAKISHTRAHYSSSKHFVYLIGQDDEAEGCDGGDIGCICITGGDGKHKYLNDDYTGCNSNDGLDMGSEVKCVMATRGCESCLPALKPYKFNSINACKAEAARRGYNKSDIYIENIN